MGKSEARPHPGPLPISSANFADAEREKRSQRLVEIMRRTVEGFAYWKWVAAYH